MNTADILRSIVLEAETADAGDEDCASNAFARIAEMASAALAGHAPQPWALSCQPPERGGPSAEG